MHCLILISFLALVSADLVITGPESLRKQFNSSNAMIDYSIGNFGDIPYGKSITGVLNNANPSIACSQIVDLKDSNENGELQFVLVKRGECTFVEKARHAEKAGASLVIIYDNKVEDTDKFIMIDDGTGSNIHIPAILISEEIGEQLVKVISESQEKVRITIKFSIFQSDVIDLKFFLTLPSSESFVFLHNFNIKRPYIRSLIDFTPYYQILECPTCKLDNEYCFGGNKYCQYDPDGDGPGTGQHILMEMLRQVCVFRFNEEAWWKYAVRFSDTCFNVSQYKSCGLEKLSLMVALDDIKFEDKLNIEKCVSSSFINDSPTKPLNQRENQILSEMLQMQQKAAIYMWPAALINNMTYRGNMDSGDIVEAVCASANNPSVYCTALLSSSSDKTGNTEKKHTGEMENGIDHSMEDLTGKTNGQVEQKIANDSKTTLIVFICLGVILVISLAILFVYKRIAKREVRGEMNDQVSEMVAQYVKFYESKEQGGRGDV